jgi:hypothetical protein
MSSLLVFSGVYVAQLGSLFLTKVLLSISYATIAYINVAVHYCIKLSLDITKYKSKKNRQYKNQTKKAEKDKD